MAERFATLGETVDAQVPGASSGDVEDEGVSTADADDVAYDLMNVRLVHVGESTPVVGSLDEIASEIYSTIDSMALRVGELLDVAYRSNSRARFERWVVDDLPFGLDTAKRLRAVYLAQRELPLHVRERLPRPWQALYALVAVGQPELERAVDDGVVHPGLTVQETREVARGLRGRTRSHVSQVDVWASRLMQQPAEELSEEMADRLGRWLSRSPHSRS